MKSLNKKWLPVLLLAPLLFIAGSAYFKAKNSRPAPEISGIYFSEPEFVAPFQLNASNGNTFTDEDLNGQWTILFFGFTYCPDVCPTTLAMLDSIVKKLAAEKPHLQKPQLVFVSVDPERDTLEKIQKYVTYFNPDFIGATGSAVELRKLARQMGVVYEKVFMDRSDPENYLMEHSTSISMINPKGSVQAIFTAPHDINTLSDDIVAVYNSY